MERFDERLAPASHQLRVGSLRVGSLQLGSLLTGLILTGCQIQGPAQPTTSLRVSGEPRDARVSVDDQKLGALAFVAEHGVALPPGRHRITVEKPGYFPFDKLVVAEEGDPPIQLTVTLDKIPE